MRSPQTPIVIIFDLDNTLVGDLSAFGYRLQTNQFIKDACRSNKLLATYCKKTPKLLEELFITEHCVRPGLKEALTTLKQAAPHLEIFVYSAGEEEYVTRIVEFLEKKYEISFARPIFSRTDCVIREDNSYGKSIQQHLPEIVKSLRVKYPQLNEKELLANKILFVDDRDVVWDHANKLVKCPVYEYPSIEDIFSGFPLEMRRLPILKQYATNAIGTMNVFIEPDNVHEIERNMLYSLFMADLYRKAMSKAVAGLTDTFFEKFTKAVKPLLKLVKPFTDEKIAGIRKVVNG